MNAPLIAGQKGSHHAICGVCARQGLQLAYIPSNDFRKALWTCGECVPLLRDTYHMTSATLSEYETRAIRAAAIRTSRPLIEAVLMALWDAGVNDLSILPPETISKIADDPPDGIRDALADALVAYAEAMRSEIREYNPPF